MSKSVTSQNLSLLSSGGAVTKHCLVEACKIKVKGNHWSRHNKDKHEGQARSEKCTGEGCLLCQQVNGISASNNGKHLDKTCTKCNATRRSDLFIKGTSECIKCPLKGSQGKRSEKAGSKKSSKYGAEQVKNDNLKQLQQDIVEQKYFKQDGVDINTVSDELESLHLGQQVDSEAIIQTQHNVLQLNKAGLSSLQDTQQQYTTHFVEQSQQINTFTNDFSVPLPLFTSRQPFMKNQWSQQQLDQHIIETLLSLQESSDLFARSYKLNSIIQQCISPVVIQFIRDKGVNLVLLQDVLIQSQQFTSTLCNEGTASLIFVSVLFKGKAYTSLQKMFRVLKEKQQLDQVLQQLHIYLEAQYGYEIAQWLCSNHTCLEEQTLSLLNYLIAICHKTATKILSLSLAVDIQGAMNQFILLIDSCSLATLPFKLILQKIEEESSHRQKLPFPQFSVLIELLLLDQNWQLIQNNQDLLITLPVLQWTATIKELQASTMIEDDPSISAALKDYAIQYGPMLRFKDVVLVDKDPIYDTTFVEAKIKPNRRQAAVAQYAVSTCSKNRLQLWTIPSGQGKSRIAATIILMLLFTKSASVVHMVFDNEHLLNRDRGLFEQYWALNNLEQQVQYHIGIASFQCAQGEAIVIDEADNFMLGDPQAFSDFIGDNICICLTATPDDQKHGGLEQKVISVLQCQRLDVFKANPAPMIDQTIKFETIEALAAFIMKERTNRAVLLFCNLSCKEYLDQQSLPFLWIHQDAIINDHCLSNLDKRNSQGLFEVIVSTNSFGMRGFDYRAPKNGITLLINASFEHDRAMIQGLGRVGRFGDPATILQVEGVPLVDKEKELAYKKKLMSYSSTFIRNRIVAKPATLSKQKHITSYSQKTNLSLTRTNQLLGKPADGKKNNDVAQQ